MSPEVENQGETTVHHRKSAHHSCPTLVRFRLHIGVIGRLVNIHSVFLFAGGAFGDFLNLIDTMNSDLLCLSLHRRTSGVRQNTSVS